MVLYGSRLWLQIACLMGVLLSLILQGCAEEIAEKAEVIRPVRTMVIEETSQQSELRLPGRIQPAEEVNMSFQVAGPLTKFDVRKGEKVGKGQLLARIEPSDYQSNVKSALARQKNAKTSLERARTLLKKQLVSKSDYDRLDAEQEVAEADLQRARKALADTYLKAPFAGVVADTFVQNFEDVQAKQVILSLQDNSSLEISVQVPEKQILHSEKNYSITAAFEGIDRVFPLTIKEFSTDADANTQTYEVILAMDNPEDINLLPGMSATVIAIRPESDSSIKAVYLPVTAIFADRTGKDIQYVWLVKEDNTVYRQQVVVVALNNNLAVIDSGLNTGQVVVTAGVHYLVEGQKVKIVADPS